MVEIFSKMKPVLLVRQPLLVFKLMHNWFLIKVSFICLGNIFKASFIKLLFQVTKNFKNISKIKSFTVVSLKTLPFFLALFF